MSLKRDILWRVGVVYLCTLVFALLILGKVLYIQIVEGEKWRGKASNMTLKDITIAPNRGNIYDEEGRLLASSVPYYELRMDLKSEALSEKVFNEKIDSLAFCLHNLFHDKSKQEYKTDLLNARKKGKRYHLIKRHVNYLQLKECKQFPIFRLGRYRGGFIYVQENRRVKPHNELASRTIGYLTRGSSGNVVGLEGAYDHYLKGVEGIRLMQKLSGDVWMPVHDGNEIEPQNGMDILSTVNVNIQDITHDAVLRQLKKSDAEYGSAVLMEVHTGNIKAIVNLKKTNSGDYSEIYNYAVGKSTEPGSTFKLISLMAALEDGLIDIEDTVNTGNGVVYYYGKKLTDSGHKAYGRISVKEAFEVSSNVGISKIITSCYKNKERLFVDRIYSMHLNEPLGLNIKGEGKPLIRYPGDELWSGISLPMMSIGYELRLTPLQILTFYNAVANNGKMIKPKFAKCIQYHGETIKEFQTEVINPSICSASTLKKAKKMLVGVVEKGTAKNLSGTPYGIAGKTGTAKIYDRGSGEYINEYEASFVGYFPAEKPKFSCIVVINKPRTGGYYGAEVAAPVFKDIADRVFASRYIHENKINIAERVKTPYTKTGNREELEYALNELNVPLKHNGIDSRWVVTKRKEEYVEIIEKKMMKNLVPDVREMGAKDAVYLLEQCGLDVIVKGRGKVVDQSIPAGSRTINGDKIILYMSFM